MANAGPVRTNAKTLKVVANAVTATIVAGSTAAYTACVWLGKPCPYSPPHKSKRASN
jgi:hypothetical protein